MDVGYVGAQDIVRAAEAQNRWIDAELERFATLESDHRLEEAGVKKALEEAWQNLESTLVPALVPAALDEAAGRLHLAEISSHATAERRQAELHRIEGRLAAIHQDARYREREARLNEIDIRLQELERYAQPLEESTAALEREPLFRELIAEGYGTERYTRSWFQLSYYRHWKHGDLIVEKHGARLGTTEFGPIRARYLEERAALDAFLEEKRSLLEEQRAIHELVEDEARWQQALASLDTNLLAGVRAKVRAHLAPMASGDVIRLFETRPDLVLAARRLEGVKAKQRYLEAIYGEFIDRPRADLLRMRQKNARDMVKLLRPKHIGRQFPRSDYERRFKDRASRMDKRTARYLEARERIVGFDDYDRFVSDVVWWDLMTDGRVDGSFIPEVHEHHLHHAHSAHAQASYASATRDDDALFGDLS